MNEYQFYTIIAILVFILIKTVLYWMMPNRKVKVISEAFKSSSQIQSIIELIKQFKK